MKIQMICITFILGFLLVTGSFAKTNDPKDKNTVDVTKKSKMELENEIVDFSAIKDELKKDGLVKGAKNYSKKVKEVKTKRIKNVNKKYSYPREVDFWTFFSEYWLVKNSQLLKWDFKKPDYGLIISFKKFLEKFGFYNKKIKILYINSPNITHMGLPSDPNEFIFLVSVPFIRTLDLSKLEISLILFEDFLRLKAGYFVKNINNKKT